jgi:ferredoxin
MKVWIDQDLCTGDGLCEEIAPDVFVLLDDGLAYVREGDTIYAEEKGNPQGAQGLATVRRGMPARRTSPSSPPRSAPASASSSSPDSGLEPTTSITLYTLSIRPPSVADAPMMRSEAVDRPETEDPGVAAERRWWGVPPTPPPPAAGAPSPTRRATCDVRREAASADHSPGHHHEAGVPTISWSGRTERPAMFQVRWRVSNTSTSANPARLVEASTRVWTWGTVGR